MGAPLKDSMATLNFSEETSLSTSLWTLFQAGFPSSGSEESLQARTPTIKFFLGPAAFRWFIFWSLEVKLRSFFLDWVARTFFLPLEIVTLAILYWCVASISYGTTKYPRGNITETYWVHTNLTEKDKLLVVEQSKNNENLLLLIWYLLQIKNKIIIVQTLLACYECKHLYRLRHCISWGNMWTWYLVIGCVQTHCARFLRD